uniref:Calponin-2 n=1 Tax=Oncorhynchus kisutch TaxID=8019 RepID=A0A8C7G517_ONCKI
MSGSSFNRGPAYGFSAEVKSKIAGKYDPQREEELKVWIEDTTGCDIGEDFQKGLKNGVILCKLINKLQPGSVKKINSSTMNWHQLENITNFIKSIQMYGLKPHDIFEANDLFESGNMTQVQSTLLSLAGTAKTKGCQSRVDIGVKYADKQERLFDEEKMKAGQCVIGLLQMGTNKGASQFSLISPCLNSIKVSILSMGDITLSSSTQAGMTAPGTRRAIYDQKLGTDKCDNSTMSLQMGSNAGANQSGQNFGLGRQIYNAKYCPKNEEEQNGAGAEYVPDYQDEGYQEFKDEAVPVYQQEGTDY